MTARTAYQFALTGYPLGHSLSPQIHHAALAACGIQGEYNLRPVAPDHPEGLAQLFVELRAGDLHGLNVTIPHKQAVLKLCDRLSPAASAIGAANLISVQEERVLGENSDAPGFLAGLKHSDFSQGTHSRAAVLGAGGSARAVVYALASHGWRVTLLARRVEQADALAKSLEAACPANSLATAPLMEQVLENLQAELLVNTTPLGMVPGVNTSPWPENLPLPAGAVVYDLVYNPRETVLLRQARAQGLKVIGGIHMLVEQAAISFERWTGLDAPRQVMLDAVSNP